MTRRWRSFAAVLAVAVSAYGAAIGGSWLFDDVHAIQDNQAVRELGNIGRFFVDPGAFSSIDMRMYRPVLLTTFAIDHAISGGAAAWFRATNVALHAACALLLLAVARRCRAPRRGALAAALLFAAHPLASESINLVSSRSDQLMVLGLLIALRFHFDVMRGSRVALLGTALGTLVACGSKETGVLVPACLVACELVVRRTGTTRWRAMAARVSPALAVAVVYLVARRALFGVATVAMPKLLGGPDPINGAGRDLVTQLCAMSHVLPKFVTQAVVPIGMSLDPYAPLHSDWSSMPVLAGIAALAIGTWLGLRAPRARPAVFLGTVVAWATALPWVLIPLNMPAAEHRFYGALAGLGLVVAVPLSRRVGARAGTVALLVTLTAFAVASARRSLQFRDPMVLWQDCLRVWPDSVRGLAGRALAHRARAWELHAAGDLDGFTTAMRAACADVERIVWRHPTFAAAARNLIEMNLELGAELGRPLTAVIVADRLRAWRPRNPFYLLLSSRSLVQLAQRSGERRFFDEAEAAALACLDVAEPKGLVFRQAAQVCVASGDPEGALEHLDRSVELGLDHGSVLLDRAEIALGLGRVAQARADVQRVLRADPFDPRANALRARIDAAAAPR